MNQNFKKLKKIQLIEEPRSEELLRSEIEDVLAGYYCTCYAVNIPGNPCTGGFSEDGTCTGNLGNNYCASIFTKN